MNVVERSTSLVSLMSQACAASPVVHAGFSAIRDAAKPVDGALKGWPDWLALNEVLAESHVTLAWFDDCVARNVRVRHWSRLEALVLRRGRASDYAYLHQDVRADIAELFEDRDVAYEALNSSSAGELRLAMALQVSAFAHVNPTSDLMEFVLTHASSQEMQELLACSFDQLRLLFLK